MQVLRTADKARQGLLAIAPPRATLGGEGRAADFWRDGFRCCPGCLAVPVAGLVEPGAVGSWLRLVGFSRGAWLGGGLVRRISCGFWRRQNQPASFPRWRAASDRSRTRVQLGSSATRHHRKIRRLFWRSIPAKIRKKSSACTCCAQRTRPGRASWQSLRLGQPSAERAGPRIFGGTASAAVQAVWLFL